MKKEVTRILAVGAGPVGLSAAYFLNRIKGIHIEIVEKNPVRETKVLSKALLVNPRTMEIFEGTPIQKELLENSLKVETVRVFRG